MRTEIDIKHARQMRDVTGAQVFSDVDSAYVTVLSVVNQLKPYKRPMCARRERCGIRFHIRMSMEARRCWIIWMRNAITARCSRHIWG